MSNLLTHCQPTPTTNVEAASCRFESQSFHTTNGPPPSTTSRNRASLMTAFASVVARNGRRSVTDLHVRRLLNYVRAHDPDGTGVKRSHQQLADKLVLSVSTCRAVIRRASQVYGLLIVIPQRHNPGGQTVNRYTIAWPAVASILPDANRQSPVRLGPNKIPVPLEARAIRTPGNTDVPVGNSSPNPFARRTTTRLTPEAYPVPARPGAAHTPGNTDVPVGTSSLNPERLTPEACPVGALSKSSNQSKTNLAHDNYIPQEPINYLLNLLNPERLIPEACPVGALPARSIKTKTTCRCDSKPYTPLPRTLTNRAMPPGPWRTLFEKLSFAIHHARRSNANGTLNYLISLRAKLKRVHVRATGWSGSPIALPAPSATSPATATEPPPYQWSPLTLRDLPDFSIPADFFDLDTDPYRPPITTDDPLPCELTHENHSPDITTYLSNTTAHPLGNTAHPLESDNDPADYADTSNTNNFETANLGNLETHNIGNSSTADLYASQFSNIHATDSAHSEAADNRPQPLIFDAHCVADPEARQQLDIALNEFLTAFEALLAHAESKKSAAIEALDKSPDPFDYWAVIQTLRPIRVAHLLTILLNDFHTLYSAHPTNSPHPLTTL